MPKPFFANVNRTRDTEEQVNDAMEWGWYWDEGLLYIVTGKDDVLGPATEMRDAMQALLDSEDHMFCRLDEYLRVDWVPKNNRYFDATLGFFVA